VALLPDSVQQQIRSGKIALHVAMKYLVPMARATLSTENIVFIGPTGVGKTGQDWAAASC
jgi:flagellar biosynthesis GTPase FlhF